MRIMRNLLMCLGIFYVSIWAGLWISMPFWRFGNGIRYGDGVFSALAMGAVLSFRRTLGALIAGALAAAAVDSQRPELWAFLVATLCVVVSPGRAHWAIAPTWWYRTENAARLLTPGVACILAAVTTAYIIRNRKSADKPKASD
jgi:hypothetical protein